MYNASPPPMVDLPLYITTYKKEVNVKPAKERVLKPQVSLPNVATHVRPRRLQKIPSGMFTPFVLRHRNGLTYCCCIAIATYPFYPPPLYAT